MRSGRAAVLLIVSAVALAGCSASNDDVGGSGYSGHEAIIVTVGVTPNTDIAPLYLGQKQGFFEDEGITLDLQAAQGGAVMLPTVISGSYDFGFSNVVSLMVAQSQGIGVQITAPGAYSTGEVGADTSAVVTMPDSGIKSAADLVGRTVATNGLHQIFDTTVDNAVDKAGAEAGGIDWVELSWPDAPPALVSGQIDAAVLVEPYLTMALNQGAVPVLWNWVETDPDLLIAAYFTSDEFAKNNPDIVERFTNATNRSLKYAQDNPDEARDIVGTFTEVDPELIKTMTMSRFEADINEDSLQLLADLSLKYGVVDNEVDISELLP